MARLTMVEALNQALAQEMRNDGRVLCLGQDIGKNGGVFRVTDGLLESFGSQRVIDTPLAESAIVGAAIGMALAGLRPIAEIQFSGFSMLALGQLEGNAARYRARTQGQWTVPLVLRMPYGGGVRAVEHHSESREAMFASIQGIKVVVPSEPRNARSLLAAAVRDPDPVVFMEPKRSYRAFRQDVPEETEIAEIGKIKVAKSGEALTLVSWGAMFPLALEAAEAVEERRGVEIEVLDLRTISPLDTETLVESVKKTGRCVIVQEAGPSFSTASEISSRVTRGAFYYLEAPIDCVTGYDVATPYFQRESYYFPNIPRIEKVIEKTLDCS